MFVTTESIHTTASPEDIWAVWSDVANWATWDQDVESCQLNGEFQSGATAVLKPRGGPRVNIEIVDCVARKSFVSHSFLPLTTIVFHHEITPETSGHKITHRVEFKGFLAPFFYCVMGRNLVRGLPQALENLARLAEKKKT